MDVLYTCDNNYVWQMGISMVSLFENNTNEKEITIYHIGSNISDENKDKLNEIIKKYNRKIVFCDISDLDLPSSLQANGRWPLICYARLYAYRIILNVDRLLYLDCDTIILSDLHELFTDTYSDKIIYGAKDFIGSNYKKLIGMPVKAPNINGGVLLFNLKKYGKIHPAERIDRFVKKFGKRISYADQDVVNGTFWRKFGYLDASYDIMSIMRCFEYKEIVLLKHPKACYTESEVKDALNNPRIIHFTGNYRFTRPWIEASNHPYKIYFDKYKKNSPWKDMKEIDQNSEKGEIALARRIRTLPSWVSCNILGLLYCYVRPLSIWIRSKRK